MMKAGRRAYLLRGAGDISYYYVGVGVPESSQAEECMATEHYRIVVDKQYLEFASAHFVTMKGTREPLHGHNYHCGVVVEGDLTDDGYVLDFSDVKRAARDACRLLDHLVLLPEHHPELRVERREGQVWVDYRQDHFEFPAADVLLLPVANTTAELLAQYLAGEIAKRLPAEKSERVLIIEVMVEEAPSQAAWFRTELNDALANQV